MTTAIENAARKAAISLVAFLILALPAAAQVNVSTTQLNFGSVHVGASVMQGVTLTNNGPSALTLSASFGPNGGGDFSFVQGSNCPVGTQLGIGASCTYQVTFAPSAVGAQTQTLFLTAFVNAVNFQQFNITLSGTGVLFLLGVNPASLNFGSVIAGSRSAAQTVIITNNDTISFYLSAPIFT